MKRSQPRETSPTKLAASAQNQQEFGKESLVGMHESSAPLLQRLGPSEDSASRPKATEPPLRVLFVQFSGNFSGSTLSGKLIVEALRETGAEVDVVFGFSGPMIAEYEKLGCTTITIEHGQWLRPADPVRCIRRFAKEIVARRQFEICIRKRPYDLVYVNSFVSGAAAWAASRCGVRCIWHLRELFQDQGGELHYPAIGGRSLVRATVRRWPDRVLAISSAILRSVFGDRVPAHASVLPNAIPAEFFSPLPDAAQCRREFSLPEGVPLIGVPATLRPVKGLEFFFDAAALLARRRPNCHFAITGHGEASYAERLRRYVADVGLADRSHFLGSVRDMPHYYSACDIVCVPSRSESFGRTVVEAMATGTPLVATHVGGIPEIVEHDRTGWLVPYGAASTLADALAALLDDPARQQRYRTAARQVAQQRYGAEMYREKLRRIVLDLCSPKPAAVAT